MYCNQREGEDFAQSDDCPPFSTFFKPAKRLNPIKPDMSPREPAQLIASAFNQLGKYASSPGYRAYCHTELAVSSLLPVLIPPTHRGTTRLG